MPAAFEGASGVRSSFDGLVAGHSGLEEQDPEVAALVAQEVDRERRTLRFIASENYVSPAVLSAASSTLTNKYANGYPGDRRYPGCDNADAVERLAIERATAVLGGDHVNVQPYSGSQANLAAYLAVAKPDDTLLTLRPDHGGHFTHGAPDNYSSAFFRIAHFEVDPSSELISLDAVREQAEKVRPAAIVVGPTAYPRSIDVAGLAATARSVGARLVVDAAHIIGLVIGGMHPDPVPHADIVTFTTHKTMRGPKGGAIVCKEELAGRVDRAVFPMVQGGPNLPGIAAKAVAFREAADASFSAYARRSVELAQALAKVLEAGGLRLVTGGTDTHIVLVDLAEFGLDGLKAERALERCGILANRSRIPFDPVEGGAGGLRFGTAAVATLGMTVDEVQAVGGAILSVLRDPDAAGSRDEASGLVEMVCERLSPYRPLGDDGRAKERIFNG